MDGWIDEDMHTCAHSFAFSGSSFSLVVNNADLLYLISPTIVPAHDSLPGMFRGTSIAQIADGLLFTHSMLVCCLVDRLIE
jgi:hypothetical protein